MGERIFFPFVAVFPLLALLKHDDSRKVKHPSEVVGLLPNSCVKDSTTQRQRLSYARAKGTAGMAAWLVFVLDASKRLDENLGMKSKIMGESLYLESTFFFFFLRWTMILFQIILYLIIIRAI